MSSEALDMGYHFHHGIWDFGTAASEHCFDQALANFIVGYFDPPTSTLDLGCGRASYLRAFHDAGWERLLGVDGTPGIAQLAHFPHIVEHDLCNRLTLPRAYELVVCLEVGEHIPVEYEKCLLDNIVRHARRDILLSWAIEGQKGPGHINCRNNDYIIAEMAKRGFDYVPTTSNALRDHSSLPWFKNTLMYFTRSQR